ncbi:MAG: hypothetical protein JF589_03250 [Gemmatimonadetes bacterium]|jgi:hypothetical protein|nr:hypothetical protein [Gemmatimonadota bacterium]
MSGTRRTRRRGTQAWRGLVLAMLVTIGGVAQAQGIASTDRVVVHRLYNGLNAIDLLGDGHRGQVIVSRRERLNAHGSSTALFQLHAFTRPADTTSAVAWQVVPFFGPDHPAEGSELIRTTEGADCVLGDLRVFRRARGRPVEVVLAYRAFGASDADSTVVRFEFYLLRTNDEGTVGAPAYYFQHVRTVRARRRYCDVNDAFAQELAMGREGLH